MTWRLQIPEELHARMAAHLFRDELEQGAFLYAEARDRWLLARELYLVPPEGWEIQSRYRLVMTDEERARVLAGAHRAAMCLVDCHSHPGSGAEVEFSPSDYGGVSEFAQYVKWKLDGRPYAALVWGEASVDGVVWDRDFASPETLQAVRVTGSQPVHLDPRDTWQRAATWRPE